MNLPFFFAELKRRNVVRFAGLYLVGAWLLVQVAGTLLPVFDAPAWVMKTLVGLLAGGLVPALIFSWVFELTTTGLKRDEDVTPEESIAPQTARRMNRLIVAVLVLALGYFGFDKFVLAPQREATLVSAATRSGVQQAAARAREVEADKSIAVLPFENRSGDTGQAYYADGLTDELTTTLARISALKVIARTSAARFKGSAKPPSTIGKELGASALVTGSVLRAGGRVRYTAELVSARTEKTLWADSFERDERDILTLQSQVAQAIAKAIEVRLSPSEATGLAGSHPVDPKAFDEYLRGRVLWNQRTEASVRDALAHFQNATRIAPDFALAFAGLADSYIILGVHGYEPPREVMPEAKAAAEHAILLDPDRGEPHASLGDILFHYDWDWAASEREHERAIELAPAYATAYQWGSEVQILNGNLDGALSRLRRARELDPLSMIVRIGVANTLGLLGKRDLAVAELREALALDPGFPRTYWELSRQLLALGRTDEALAQARRMVELDPDAVPSLALLGLCLGRAGHAGEARAILKRLDGESATRFVSALELARITAGLRDRDATIGYLERAVAAREGFLPFVAGDDEFAFLNDDPRFAVIMRTIGIPLGASTPAVRGQ
jgi:TolB-like protein/Tfp pilus assembly protein PilF